MTLIGQMPNAVKREFENNGSLLEIKRDSIWRLGRAAQEHLDRLLWALDGDDVEVRDQCRAVVSHVRAIAILINDLRDGGGQ